MERVVPIKNNLELIVKTATIDDAAGMVKTIQQITYESENITWEPGSFHYSVEQEQEFIQQANQTINTTFIIGIIDNEVVCVSNVGGSSKPRLSHMGEISISVLKKYWNMGVGTAVMQAIIDWAKETGLRKLNLSVRSDHKAGIALYEKLGFVKEGTRTRTMLINGEFIATDEMGLEIDP